MPVPTSEARSKGAGRAAAAAPRAAAATRAEQSPHTRGRAQARAATPAPSLSRFAGRFRDALAKLVPSAPKPRKPPEAPPPAEAAVAPESAAPGGQLPPRAPTRPADDPLFQKAKGEVRTESRRQRRHPPAGQKRAEAAAAAALTEGEQVEQSSKEKGTAEMKQVGSAQQGAASRFSAESFKQELMTRINTKKPRDEGEAKALAKDPPLQGFEQDFAGRVAEKQSEVTGPLEKRASEPPSGGKAEKLDAGVPKPKPSPAPKPLDAKLAAPKPKAWWEISLKHESDKLDGAMRDNRLSEQQLADSREPKFIETLELKREAQKKAAEAPEVYRQKEAALLQGAQAQADKSLGGGLQGMQATHRRSASQVFGGQEKTETRTEKRQREIKRTIDGIYDDTVREVKRDLEELANGVKERFANALKKQTEHFNEEVRRRISDYYGDWRIDDDLFGPADVVVKDDGTTRAMTLEEKFGGGGKRINPDVYRIFVQEKDKFLRAMDTALDGIAENVQTGLTAAHNRIRAGEAAIAVFKATLSGEELAYATELEQEVKMKFETLEASIDDTREDLLQTLADQYSENVAQLEKTFNEINDELKKGWLERAAEFIKTVAKTIFQLADLLLTILSRMASLIWEIVKHPIRFFETLVGGLVRGIKDFVDNIGTYMQEAFWTWVTGTTSAKGIRLSSGSGVESLLGIVLQVLALTPADLRASAEKILGKEFMQVFDKGMHLAEKALEPVTILLTKGPGALWQWIKETLASTIQSTFDRIRQSVFNTFVEKALKWIAGFFIPGGGFVKVVKAVFRAFQFVVENLERIKHFFNSVFDSMEAATQGKTEAVASRIVTGLKLGIVMALDFLAKQIGLGAIVDSVQRIIQSLRRPIVAAVEWLLNKIKPFTTKLLAKGKELVAKALGGDPNASPEQRLQNGLREGTQAVNRLSGNRIGITLINPVLASVRLRNNMRRLAAEPRGTTWAVVGEVNPRGEKLTQKLVETGAATAKFRSSITYSPVNDLGFGTKMVADPVGPGHPAGSTVSQTLRLELREEDHGSREGLGGIAQRQGRYRLGHLLNHHIGGPGDDWRNLTPITPSANSNHLHSVEKDVKALIIDHKRWVRYEVVADYSGSAPAAPAGGKVNPLEKKFARRLKWSYQLKKAGDKPNELEDDTKAVGSIAAKDSGKVESITDGYPS